MQNLGEFLKQTRIERGMTLEQLASQTKISLKMLQALESDDFAQIPSEVLAKGFVRACVRCLKLDEQEALKRLQDQAVPCFTKTSEITAHQAILVPGLAKPGRLTKLVAGAAVTGLIVLFGVALYEQLTAPPRSPIQNSGLTPAMAIREAEPPPVQADVTEHEMKQSTVVPVELTVNTPQLSSKPAPPSVENLKVGARTGSKKADLILTIAAAERSWVIARIDDQVVKEVLLQPGERVRWQASDKFVLTLGNAGGVRLELNGETLDPLGPSGKVVKNVVLTR